MRHFLTGFMTATGTSPQLEIDLNPFDFTLVKPETSTGYYELRGFHNTFGILKLGKCKLFIQPSYSQDTCPYTTIVDHVAGEPDYIGISTIDTTGNRDNCLNKTPFFLIVDFCETEPELESEDPQP